MPNAKVVGDAVGVVHGAKTNGDQVYVKPETGPTAALNVHKLVPEIPVVILVGVFQFPAAPTVSAL